MWQSNEAFEQYPNLDGLIFHSDQGWQYQMRPYQEWLRGKGILQSFSRKGNCMGNSLMENFFFIMKNEMYHGYAFSSLEELRRAMEEYIVYYNTKRINLKRKGLLPLAYRQQSLSVLQLNDQVQLWGVTSSAIKNILRFEQLNINYLIYIRQKRKSKLLKKPISL